MAVVTFLSSGSYTASTLTTTLVSSSFNTGTSATGAKRMLLVFAISDNYGTSGAGSIIAPTNTAGLTFTPVIANNSSLVSSPTTLIGGTGYTTITNPSASPAVGSGVSLSAWWCVLPPPWADTAMTITFNFSPSTRTKAYSIYAIDAEDFSVNPTQTPTFIPAGATTTTPSMASGAVTNGAIWWAVSGAETNVAISSTWANGILGSAGVLTANSGSALTSQRLYIDYASPSGAASASYSYSYTQTSVDTQIFGFTAYPFETPSAPQAVQVTANLNQSCLLSWSNPNNYGGRPISDFTIQYRVVGTSTWTTWSHTASAATSATVTGLTNGLAYEFQVAAVTSFSSTTKTSAFAQSANNGQPSLGVLIWGQDCADIDPTKIIPWNQFWSTEQSSFQQYINSGTLTDGSVIGASTSTSWLPSVGSATVAGSNAANYRANKSEVNYYDSVGRPRMEYTLGTPLSGTYLEIWWVANLLDVVLPTTGSTSSLWFGWPYSGLSGTCLFDYRDTTSAKFCFVDTSGNLITAGATSFTTPGTYLYRIVLTNAATTASLYRNNQLFTNSSSANGFYNATGSYTFNFGWAISGASTMRQSAANTGPYVPFFGIYNASTLTTTAQQDKMLQWAKAKYNLSA